MGQDSSIPPPCRRGPTTVGRRAMTTPDDDAYRASARAASLNAPSRGLLARAVTSPSIRPTVARGFVRSSFPIGLEGIGRRIGLRSTTTTRAE